MPVSRNRLPIVEIHLPIGADGLLPRVDELPTGQNPLPISLDRLPIGQNYLPVSQNRLPTGWEHLPIGQNCLPMSRERLQAEIGGRRMCLFLNGLVWISRKVLSNLDVWAYNRGVLTSNQVLHKETYALWKLQKETNMTC